MFIKKGIFDTSVQYAGSVGTNVRVLLKEGWVSVCVNEVTDKDFKGSKKNYFNLFVSDIPKVLGLIKSRVKYTTANGAEVMASASVKNKNQKGGEDQLSIVYIDEKSAFYVGIYNNGKLLGAAVPFYEMDGIAIVLDQVLRNMAQTSDPLPDKLPALSGMGGYEQPSNTDLPIIQIDQVNTPNITGITEPINTTKSSGPVIPAGDPLWAALGGTDTGVIVDENGVEQAFK